MNYCHVLRGNFGRFEVRFEKNSLGSLRIAPQPDPTLAIVDDYASSCAAAPELEVGCLLNAHLQPWVCISYIMQTLTFLEWRMAFTTANDGEPFDNATVDTSIHPSSLSHPNTSSPNQETIPELRAHAAGDGRACRSLPGIFIPLQQLRCSHSTHPPAAVFLQQTWSIS